MTDILMPRLSDTMEEGVISRWNVEVGDEVTKGDILGEIETDKATMDFEAYDTGVVSSLLVEEGATVAIGERVAVLGEDADDTGDADDEPDEGEEPADEGEPAAGDDSDDGEEPEAGDEATASGDSGGDEESEAGDESDDTGEPANSTDVSETSDEAGSGVRISPLARKMAEKHEIDTAEVDGTGPRGRIIRVDVEKAISERDESGDGHDDRSVSQQESTGDTTVSLNANQRVTAQRLSDSAGVPTFRLTAKVDADALMTFRSEINERLEPTGDKVSITDLLTRACAVMLRAHPEVNASWNEDSIIRRGAVNIGIAVALDSGLIVPVVKDADRKSVSQIGRESRDLAERAKSGKLHPDEFSGGSFSISNLGMYGIDDFTAIINPPEAAILAVGAAIDEPVLRDGELTTRTVITMTMTVDHRVLNGAEAAVFLGDLTSLLEEPLRIVV